MRISDWSSDVCSSDLLAVVQLEAEPRRRDDRKVPARVGRDGLQVPVHHPGRLPRAEDRKSVVSGKSVSVRVDLGGRRIIKKKKQQYELNTKQIVIDSAKTQIHRR